MRITLKNIVLTLGFIISGQIMAQKTDSTTTSKVGEVVSFRESLFKKKLSLSEGESKQFFTIYDLYISDLTKAKKVFRNKWKKKPLETLTEEEANEYFNDALSLQQKEVDLFKSCSEQLKSVIPMTKIVKLASIEREVRLKLIEKANEVKLPIKKRKASTNITPNVN